MFDLRLLRQIEKNLIGIGRPTARSTNAAIIVRVVASLPLNLLMGNGATPLIALLLIAELALTWMWWSVFRSHDGDGAAGRLLVVIAAIALIGATGGFVGGGRELLPVLLAPLTSALTCAVMVRLPTVHIRYLEKFGHG